MDPVASSSQFDPDRILGVLDSHRVEYVLVGGLAARAHGAQRATADIDFVPAATPPSHPKSDLFSNVGRSHGQVRTLFAM